MELRVLALNGWEHYELEKEMVNANMATLLELYKRENNVYLEGCKNYVKVLPDLTEEGDAKIKGELALQHERCIKLSLRIADDLTNTDKK